LTSLRKRIESGDLDIFDFDLWKKGKGTTPLCCFDIKKERKIIPIIPIYPLRLVHQRFIEVDEWLMKCDSSPWLPKEKFHKYCLNCQREIAVMLGCHGCAHEAMCYENPELKPEGTSEPSGETACMLCWRNKEYKEWYADAKKFFGGNLIWRIRLWKNFRESKRRDMYMTLEEFKCDLRK